MSTAKQILTDAGLQDSHWGKRIIKAEERGYFYVIDTREAQKWQTCACGKQDPRIPRRDSKYEGRVGAPVDAELLDLGLDFFGAVDSQLFMQSAEVLVEIEKRASEILADTSLQHHQV